MRPEMPYLAAGAVAIVGGAAKEKHWPSNGTRALVGTIAAVLVASASADTPLAELVHAFGLLVLLVATISAINLNRKK